MNCKIKETAPLKRRLLLITCLILLLFCCATSFAMYWRILELKRNGTYGMNNVQHNITLLTKTINDTWLYDGNIIYGEKLGNREEDEYSFSLNCFSDVDRVLICRISENDCESCVNYLLGVINSFACDSTFNLKMAVWGKYSRMGLKILQQRAALDENIKVYCVPNTILPIDDQNSPYVFVIDKDFRVSNVYVPNRMNQKLTDVYFELLKHKYQ